MAASHCLAVPVVFVIHFPLLLLFAPSWCLIVVPCWFERLCLFCCGPKHVGVVPVSERPRWPFCNCPCLWLMRTLHSVLLPCLGVCYDWCCVVSPTHFLHRSRLLRFCPHVWLVRALCRFCSAVCAIVTAAAVATHQRSPAWHRRLLITGKIAIHHGSCLPGAMSQKGRRQQKECKSGVCQQRGHHSDSVASRESAEEHEGWSSGSCKRCDGQQNRDSEAGNLCEGTVSCPALEGAGSTYACGGGSGEEAQRGLDCQRGGQGGPACAEPPATHGRAHGEDLRGHGHKHERRTVELWRMTRCWWLLVWLAVGSAGW